jgi:hypothetical protein
LLQVKKLSMKDCLMWQQQQQHMANRLATTAAALVEA